METKKCSRCGCMKSLDSFYKNASMKDGLQTHCKACQSEISKERNSKPLIRVKSEALAGVNKLPAPDKNNPLTAYSPRQLMAELHRRGYEGELTYTSKINISRM